MGNQKTKPLSNGLEGKAEGNEGIVRIGHQVHTIRSSEPGLDEDEDENDDNGRDS